jgi:hypothetical protein
MGHRFVRFGLQYILASRGLHGTTQPLQLHSDCIGNGEDPLAKTFQQVSPGFEWRWRFTMYRYRTVEAMLHQLETIR